MVQRACDRVRLYRERMKAQGVTPSDLSCLADLKKLPFTVKGDLREAYPFGL
jgi:phenylacetate-CoA ligase